LRGLGLLGRLRFATNLAAGTLRSLVLLSRWRPDIVLGTGGYACTPVMVAARLLRVPCVLHESNAVPGSANRLVGRWCDGIYLGFAAAAAWFAPGVTVVTGNPVREAFAGVPCEPEPTPRRPARVLVFGGSGGARTLNRATAEAAATWCARPGLELRIQTGAADLEATRAAFAAADPARVAVVPYIDDMAAALDWADLVVCRAGAMTLAELQTAGKPALLVPFPHATDDHQRRNALACAQAGAARVLEDADCDGAALTAVVDELLAEPARLRDMGAAARGLARPEAAAVIAGDLLHRIGHARGVPATDPPTADT
jgi:UDP-N-acetylglucosamine--N-acetylmuramyl-(pentapeptide) pyrophosphoryl-undecaprenol N-acetylglucosamine transferase